jgi:hypothetical protein
MTNRLRFDITVDGLSEQTDSALNLREDNSGLDAMKCARLLEAIGSGMRPGEIRVVTGAVRAVASGTFTDNPTAADTVTINGVAFTARASGAVANEFNLVSGGSNAADAAGNATALAAAINASTTAKIKGVIKATATLGVVDLECLVPGSLGLLCTLAESMGNFTVTGANFTLGAENTPKVIGRGR